jgi:uncharacterized damage-inducible protein DinB
MHPRTTEVLNYLEAQHAVLEQTIAAIPPAYHAKRPGPERWSIAEVLAHVAIVEHFIVRLLRAKLDAARAAGLGPERDTSPVVRTFDIDRVHDRSRRVEAMPEVYPPPDADVTTAMRSIAEAHEAIRALITSADGLALSEVSAPNPVLGPLNVYQWVAFLGGHEARHVGQIVEAARQLGAPIGATAS